MGREQKVVIAGTVSETKPSKYGVPQGSVLGPKKYCTYTKPVDSIIKAHNIDYHIYADDTQLYIALKPGKTENAVRQLELCIDDVRKWMETNYLKLNKDKTEFIIFGSKSNLKKHQNINIKVGGHSSTPGQATRTVRNLGVTYDPQLKMSDHITSIARSTTKCLYNI